MVNLVPLVGVGFAVEKATAISDSIDSALGGTVSAAVAAAGVNQANATALVSNINVVTSSTSGSAEGVKLPVAATAGDKYQIFNGTSHPILVYPMSGGAINGLATNAPIYLKPRGHVSVFMATATEAWAIGEEISSLRNEWIHLRTTKANDTSITTIFTRAVAEQEGLWLDGYFYGAYVGKTTAACSFAGRFYGGGSRSAAGALAGAVTVGNDFQSALTTGSPVTAATATASNGSTNGTFRGIAANSAVNTSAVFPIVRTNISSNDFIVQARGIATDTLEYFVSFKLVTTAGQ